MNVKLRTSLLYCVRKAYESHIDIVLLPSKLDRFEEQGIEFYV